MNKEASIIYMNSGIVDDPRFCIRGLSTFACVCDECMQSYVKSFGGLLA